MSLLTPARTLAAPGCRALLPGLMKDHRRIVLVRGGSAHWAEDLARPLSAFAAVEIILHHGEPKDSDVTGALARLRPFGPRPWWPWVAALSSIWARRSPHCCRATAH